MVHCPKELAGLVNNSICEEEVFALARCDYDGYDCCDNNRTGRFHIDYY